jgi:hypothetical protein
VSWLHALLLDDGPAQTAVRALGANGDVALAAARFGAAASPVLAVLALAVGAYASHLARLRDHEADGLLATPPSRWAWTLGGFAGATGVLALALAASFAVQHVHGHGLAVDGVFVRRLDVPPLALVGQRDARALVLDATDVAGFERLRVRLVALPDQGSVVFVSLTAQRLAADGATPVGEARRAEARVFARGTLAVDVPAGEGALLVRLARIGRGAGVGIERDGLQGEALARGRTLAPLRLFVALVCALASMAALAAACVPHTSALVATLVALVPWAIAAALAEAPRWLPGHEWILGLALVQGGTSPPWPSPWSTLAVVAPALCAAALAPRFARQTEAL